MSNSHQSHEQRYREYRRSALQRPRDPAPPPQRPQPLPGPAGPRRPRGRALSGLLVAALLLVALLFFVFAGGMLAYASIARELPLPEELEIRTSTFASTEIYDRDGNLLNEVFDPEVGRRTRVPLERVSPYLIQATVATEDANFYEHPGVDPVAYLRIIYHAVREREVIGGSTITQQLVKLAFLTPERTIERKIKEGILAAEITRRYPKDTILEIYINETGRVGPAGRTAAGSQLLRSLR